MHLFEKQLGIILSRVYNEHSMGKGNTTGLFAPYEQLSVKYYSIFQLFLEIIFQNVRSACTTTTEV